MVTRRQFGSALLGAVLLSGCARTAAIDPGRKPTPVGEWVRLPEAPLEPRYDATGGWLGGRFVITGGQATLPCPPGASCLPPKVPALRDGAAFDPATGRWERLPDAPTPIAGQFGTGVIGDRLYILSLNNGQPDSPDAMLAYDGKRDAWSRLPLPPETRVALLAHQRGGLFAIGWTDDRGAVADHWFDPEAERWVRLPDDPLGPSYGRLGVWHDDRLLLVASGGARKPRSDRERRFRLAWWDPQSGRWARGVDPEAIGSGVVWMADRVVSPVLGSKPNKDDWVRSHPFGAILDPATGRWTALPEPPAGRGIGGNTLTVDDLVAIHGQLLDPVKLDWTSVPPSPLLDRVGSTVVGGAGMILTWGGSDNKINFADGHLLRLR